MTSQPDFYLLAVVGEWSVATSELDEVWTAIGDEPELILRCCPSDGIMRDATEDLAIAWCASHAPGWDKLPVVFRDVAPTEWVRRAEYIENGDETPDISWEGAR
jgi:hypothetical protein